MKKFFFSHPDVILSGIAFILLAILIGFFSWAINDVVSEIHLATVASGISSGQGFDLQSAAKINLHGASTSSAPSSVVASSSVVVSTSTTPATSTASTTRTIPTTTASSSPR